MAAFLNFFKAIFKGTRRVLTGEIIRRFDIEIAGGLTVISLLLKHERKSIEEYFVLGASGGMGGYYYLCSIERDEFDRFIEAADIIRASQTLPTEESLYAAKKPGRWGLILTGDVLKRIDTEIWAGWIKLSLRLKRERKAPHEYVVLACTTSGHYQYFSFELDEFYRFVTGAKRLRAAIDSPLLKTVVH